MKHLLTLSAIVLIAWLAYVPTPPAAAAKSYHLTLEGVEVSGGARGTLALVGKAGGPLAGSFEVSLRYNPVTGEATGGTWKLTVAPRGRGERGAQGALAGSVEGGIVRLGENGKVESAEAVRLVVRRGAGGYSGVTAGAGELEGTLNPRRPHPFAGALRLSFQAAG